MRANRRSNYTAIEKRETLAFYFTIPTGLIGFNQCIIDERGVGAGTQRRANAEKICAIAKIKELPIPIIAVPKAIINTPIEVAYFLPILSANARSGSQKTMM